MSDGVHASMAPNAIACKVVMDRSPNPINQRTTQRLDFDQRMTRPRPLCDVEQPLAQRLFGLLLCCDAEQSLRLLLQRHIGCRSAGDNVRLSDLEPKFTCKACVTAAPMSGRSSNTRAWGLAESPRPTGRPFA